MTEDKGRARVVLCLSGGMDSCVCAALAAREGELYAVHVSYGQRTEAHELRSARAIAEAVGAKEFLHLRVDLFRRIGGSALTDETIAVPEAAADEALIGAEVPVTYVPFRNTHLLASAVSWAEVLGADDACLSGQWSRTARGIRTAGRRFMTRSTR